MNKFIDPQIFDYFIKESRNVPEVHAALLQIQKENKELFLNTLNLYAELVRELVDLSEEDLMKIKSIHSNFEKYITAGGIEEPGAHTFIKILKKENTKYLLEVIVNIADINTDLFEQSVEMLFEMMGKASDLKKTGKDFVDGNTEADKVIWSHTKVSNPELILHITIAHFFERSIFIFLKEKLNLNFTKDYFLNVLDDIIILRSKRNQGDSYIFNVWNRTKDNGGLGWINPKKVEQYQIIFATPQ